MKTKPVNLDWKVGRDLTIRNKLEFLTRDNPNPVLRPAHAGVARELVPLWTKMVNTKGKELPTHLLELEIMYKTRVRWQRSNYKWETLRKMLHSFSNTLHYAEAPLLEQSELETWLPVSRLQATTHRFTTEGSDLSKSAGLPKFGSKRQQLEGMKQHAETIKASGTLNEMYPIFPGFRTQQSPPDTPKVRGINMIPGSTWVLEREAWPDVLQKAKAHWNKPGAAVDHMPPEQTWKCFVEMAAASQSISVIDSTLYDTTVHANENDASVELFIPSYEFKDLLKSYYNTAEILMPKGEMIERNGGMSSGRTDTNFTDSWTNIADLVQSARAIVRYLVGYHVRGDDIILFWDTQVRQDNIKALSNQSRRTINPDKSDIRTSSAWFAKLYLDPDLDGWTKPGFLVCNSLMYKERESDAITSSKEYAAIAATSILSSMEYHPWGDKFRNTYWKRCDKYPIQSFGTEELIPAMEAYQSSHSWQVEHGILPEDPWQAVETLRRSWAAELS
jgi:hypothetical protein